MSNMSPSVHVSRHVITGWRAGLVLAAAGNTGSCTSLGCTDITVLFINLLFWCYFTASAKPDFILYPQCTNWQQLWRIFHVPCLFLTAVAKLLYDTHDDDDDDDSPATASLVCYGVCTTVSCTKPVLAVLSLQSEKTNTTLKIYKNHRKTDHVWWASKQTRNSGLRRRQTRCVAVISTMRLVTIYNWTVGGYLLQHMNYAAGLMSRGPA